MDSDRQYSSVLPFRKAVTLYNDIQNNMTNLYKTIPPITFLLMALLISSCASSIKTSDSHVAKSVADKTESPSSTTKSETCEITCPHCGHKKTETLPTEVCQIKYKCENCQVILTPEGDDCCVYCTHSTHKCPSKQ
ncbi:MAG: hypothetical protein ACI8XB_002380 [Patiriisocius sp.]|jgi:hypothetical protein